MSRRARAMMVPGMFLSQPAMQTRPSKVLPRATNSMLSAMTSRRDERGFHALGAHGDAVGDGDGVELHGRAAGVADALLDGLGDIAEMEVAGADLGPGVGDADDGLVQVFFAEADAAQIGAGGGAAGAFGEDDGVLLCGIEWGGQSVPSVLLMATGRLRDDLGHRVVKAGLVAVSREASCRTVRSL